jgi:hypothetical protein
MRPPDFGFWERQTKSCRWYVKRPQFPKIPWSGRMVFLAFRIEGILDFSLIGILSKISTVLADHGIGIFAVSTFNTDYILVKKENYEKALNHLETAGYTVTGTKEED